MNMLPIFLKLTGRRCLLVGAGTVALDKIASLLSTGAQLCVVAPEARAEIRRLADEGKLQWMERRFELSDLDGNFVVIAATDSPDVNARCAPGLRGAQHSLQQRGRHSQLRFLFRVSGEPRQLADCDFDGRRKPCFRTATAA